MEEETNKSSGKIVIVILALLLIGSIGYLIYQNSEHEAHKKIAEQTEQELKSDIEVKLAELEQMTASNDELKAEIEAKVAEYTSMKEELDGKVSKNYGLYQKYLGRYKKANAELKKLQEENTRIKEENEILKTNLADTQLSLESQTNLAEDLKRKKESLEDKVALGAKLKIDHLQLVGMKERSKGKLKLTNKSRNTDVFKVSLLIEENPLVEENVKEVPVYIEILGPNKAAVNPQGVIGLNNGSQIEFTEVNTVEYDKTDILEVLTVINVDRKKITKGTYTANVYIEGDIVGTTTLDLK
ncbi:hypothetical protein [Aureivirga sp. CE67]|uniref:hypothetical protein n=1 Tax=Aureivirga sp. CE67 TaxID=1788983 RepID=UPI0018C9B880|nr:hypothetical protein [Aureivirga sp. CE67]